MKRNIYQAMESVDKHGIAYEAMLQAEMEFSDKNFVDETLQEDKGFTAMAFKDDDGWWRITGRGGRYASQDELIRNNPDVA